MQDTFWLAANWQAPSSLIAGTSLSNSPFMAQGFNLAQHVNDNAERVSQHRLQLAHATGLNNTWLWLSQTHSDIVVTDDNYYHGIEADAVISRNPERTAVVMTADCLPILICNHNATEVAAIHAGWQGLYKEIIHATIFQMNSAATELFVWIGPCATALNYEVDMAFYQRFVEKNSAFADFFQANREGHFLADLPAIARYQLQASGVSAQHISGGNLCSIADKRFFSHRRDGAKAGRMASFIAPIKNPA